MSERRTTPIARAPGAVRRLFVGSVAAIAGLLFVAGAAWACTAQPRIFSLSSDSGPVGTELTMQGEEAQPGGAVEVRWDTMDGSILASGTADADGRFSIPLVVPEAVPGVHAVMAVVDSVGVARSTFEVTAPGGSAARTSSAVSPWDAASASTGSPSNPSLVLGMSLLGVGLITLFAGFAGASLRRRQAAASIR